MTAIIEVPSTRKFRRSHNLRGLLDYARVSPVVRVTMGSADDRPGRYSLVVRFADGARGVTSFVDYSVLRDWVKARRSWQPCEVVDLLPVRVNVDHLRRA